VASVADVWFLFLVGPTRGAAIPFFLFGATHLLASPLKRDGHFYIVYYIINNKFLPHDTCSISLIGLMSFSHRELPVAFRVHISVFLTMLSFKSKLLANS
jgi:hypothetical protein